MNGYKNVEFPVKLKPLFSDSRYVCLYGGRGGGKSWNICRFLLIIAAQKPMRILCAREWMSSLADSVHRLLCDQIMDLGLEDFYDMGKATITGKNGSEFRFAGLKTNVSALKSFESIDIVFVEEAANVSKYSWSVLIPTIRKEGSRIIISFNPELETDETYQRFVVNPPPNCQTIKINYDDNPYFPNVLKEEMEYLKRIDENAYNNVWLGFPKTFLEGAVYSNELIKAENENRITKVPYDSLKPVHTFWDIGFRDTTSIIFAQTIGSEYRIIDYYENNQLPIDHYLQELQGRGYIYGVDHLPHDAKAKSIGTGRSVEELMREKGRKVRIVPRLSIEDGINAARTIFQNIYFDKEKCSDLVQWLRKYRYEVNNGSLTNNKPIHDGASHAADAFRYLAVMLREPKKPFDISKLKPVFKGSSNGSWLAR